MITDQEFLRTLKADDSDECEIHRLSSEDRHNIRRIELWTLLKDGLAGGAAGGVAFVIEEYVTEWLGFDGYQRVGEAEENDFAESWDNWQLWLAWWSIVLFVSVVVTTVEVVLVYFANMEGPLHYTTLHYNCTCTYAHG